MDAIDLFAGAGGFTTGATAAGVRVVYAANHWRAAVDAHAANHPDVTHACQDLHQADWHKLPRHDLLLASPSCQGHSRARGKDKPRHDAARSTAWAVVSCAEVHRSPFVIVENVPEFLTWGPLGVDGRPLASKKGAIFAKWVETLEAMGYRVEWRILNAADFGAATSRRRLFVQAAKGRRAIHWPDPTHARKPESDGLFADRKPWRAAREVIDWGLTGESIFGRKRPLSPNTLRRIEAGLKKFGGANAEPFLIALRHMANAEGDGRGCRSLDVPTPTVTASGTNIGLVEPFTVKVTGQGDDACRVRAGNEPLHTITAGANGLGVCEPFILPPEGVHRGNAPRDPSNPLQTVTAGRGGGHLVQPFIVPTNYGEREGQSPRCHDIEGPVPTVVASGQTHGVVEPFILPHRQFDRMDVDSVGTPLRTITTANGHLNAVVEPFVVPYYGTGEADSPADPLRTVTARDRFGLVQPDGCRIDIRFRMLQPHELAAAMGFPAGYTLTGNRAEQVRQIGNAVEVNVADALASAILEAA